MQFCFVQAEELTVSKKKFLYIHILHTSRSVLFPLIGQGNFWPGYLVTRALYQVIDVSWGGYRSFLSGPFDENRENRRKMG